MDTHKRSIAKTVMYKGGSVVVLALLSWLFTRNLAQMSLITICYEILAGIAFYINERIWTRIPWGAER